MINILKIAWRNLFRYTRRTLLTASLIVFGVALVIVFGGIGNSFKDGIVGILTNSNLGDLQIHKKGYVGSIDNLPLDLTIPEAGRIKIESILNKNAAIKDYSKRIRFGAVISNFVQSTNMRLTAVYPGDESQVCPDLPKRIKDGDSNPDTFVKPGSIVIPLNIANGMKLKTGDEVVLVATNKEGSVNGMTFKISGISENILGPQGKDGYMHMEDAFSLLRIEGGEITEIAVKINDFSRLRKTTRELKHALPGIAGASPDKPFLEIHTWEDLSPFSSIARIVTLLIMVVRVVLVSIVLISILNVMMMSVYERIGEIGTIASLGTLPGKILMLFLAEGLSLGFFSALAGGILGTGILAVLAVIKPQFTFGMMELSLAPQIPMGEIIVSIAIVVVISTLASLQPALKAAKMEPVEALRHV
ncbi:ABC transporter permease [candidate division FCPU426 bacterium]|nr:ABC transporter permease [candidate division FCPU426 bacterium]